MSRSAVIPLLLLISVALPAQSVGDDYHDFLRQSNLKARAFRNSSRQEFGAFLRRTWHAEPESSPREDPFERGDAGRPKGEVLRDEPLPIEDAVVQKSIPPAEATGSEGVHAFHFYGRTYKVRYDRTSDLRLNSISEEDVASAWDALSIGSARLVGDCTSIKEQAALCDWAYLQLVDSLSRSIYPVLENERELLFGFIMGMSGFDVRFGRTEEELICLYGTKQIIYSRPFFRKDEAYFFRHREGTGSLVLSDPVPGENRPLDLELKQYPEFAAGRESVRHIKSGSIEFDYRISADQLAFLASYPHTEMHIKADAPAGEAIRNTVYPALSSAIHGKGQIEAANIILAFVQGLMTYQTDSQRWGYEKWNFPAESFYYLCGDCDDHAILFARLIRDLLDLDVLLVECQVNGMPHETTAVRFTEPLSGDTIRYDGATYYCCEPTSNVGKAGQRRWENYVVKRLDKVK